MVNGNNLYGQGQAFTFQMAIALAAVQPAEQPRDTVEIKSFQAHLADALKNE